LNLNGRLTTERNNPVVGTYQNWQWWVLCLLSVSRSSFCATGLYQIPNAHHGFRVGPGVITANSKTTTNPRKSVNSNIMETGGRFWIETWARQCIYYIPANFRRIPNLDLRVPSNQYESA
jgi:hypothetical protein